MIEVQYVVLELESEYAGHPYYVTGNAILHALAQRLEYDQQRALAVSHGVFAPGSNGTAPWYGSEAFHGYEFSVGASVPDITTYQDFFLLRRPHHPWLPGSSPRDAKNAHDLKILDGRPVINPKSHHGDAESWYVHLYLHGRPTPLSEDVLDGLQLGGKRNYGFGLTSLADVATLDIDALDYGWLGSDGHVLELVTPYVLSSEHPNTDDTGIPRWWDTSIDYRRRPEAIVEQRQHYRLETADHGQVTRYEGDAPIETAKNGIERVGTHSKYGFGELMIRPAKS